MARKLSHITSKLCAFLNANYPKGKICNDIISCENGKLNIPNIVLITNVIGKAEFDRCFYEYLINKNQNLDDLKQQITKQLNQLWNKKTTLKESYIVEPESVEFKLIAKVEDHQDTMLINQQGKRLNPTRLSAYQNLLQQLTSSYYHFLHPAKI